jgi:hypothetical protein
MLLGASAVNAVQLPENYDISGEVRAGYNKGSGFTTTNTRLTVENVTAFDSGVEVTTKGHFVRIESGYSVLADVTAQASFGTLAAGNYQGLDRKWGNLATVTRTIAGDGLFQGESTAVSLMTPAYYGFTAGVSLNTVKTSEGNKDGGVVGLRYKLDGLSATVTAGKVSGDAQCRKQFAISYGNQYGRIAYEKIQRSPIDSDTTASVIYQATPSSVVYVEKRTNVSEMNGKVNTTAAGVKYSTSKLTEFVVEKSNNGKAFIGVISRF